MAKKIRNNKIKTKLPTQMSSLEYLLNKLGCPGDDSELS